MAKVRLKLIAPGNSKTDSCTASAASERSIKAARASDRA